MFQSLSLFQATSRRLDFLEARHEALVRNIANADTPGYRAVDVSEPRFDVHLEQAGGVRSPSLSRTHAGHIDVAGAPSHEAETSRTFEVTPSGNGVVLEEQAAKLASNGSDHRLASTLYKKYADMIRAALSTQS
ncbi:MAG: flagellar basal body rod protein FlgB [Geminicoccaceae bacterium]